MGVWIETNSAAKAAKAQLVTPFVGVWIETISTMGKKRQRLVTPFVGVWIETLIDTIFIIVLDRHTLRGCVD